MDNSRMAAGRQRRSRAGATHSRKQRLIGPCHSVHVIPCGPFR
jgi:hypothetical protein